MINNITNVLRLAQSAEHTNNKDALQNILRLVEDAIYSTLDNKFLNENYRLKLHYYACILEKKLLGI